MDLSTALAAAIEAGDQVRGTTSPNPPVGAAVLDADGELVGLGATRPTGGPHAEIMALHQAGDRARGGTAVVTLEPCNHHGRTGPCSQALIDAGITHLHYVHPDPGKTAGGGADHLRAHGIGVTRIDTAVPGLRPWLSAVTLGRPHVTLKFAQTLDGFTAAPDGTSQWITGEQARRNVHEDRRRRDAIIIGTGTALADNPSLTARTVTGELHPEQPRRVVIGRREIPVAAAPNLHRLGFVRYPEISAALSALWEEGARDVLVEGGAGLASAFLAADLVDAVHAYVAPTLLGAGRGVLAQAVGDSLVDAARFSFDSVTRLGDDVFYEMTRKEVH